MNSRNTTNPENEMQIGTHIYYHGDMANQSGFFKVVEIDGSHAKMVEIEVEGCNEIRNINIPVYGIDNEYKGHGGTRFVTRDAYNAYREEILNK
jgi:hypothetical protein